MTFTEKELQSLITKLMEYSNKTMSIKKKDYSPHTNRLDNFNQRAEMLGVTPAQVCVTDLSKHMQSLCSNVNQSNYTEKWYLFDAETGAEGLTSRIIDSINYLFLLSACIEAEIKEQ